MFITGKNQDRGGCDGQIDNVHTPLDPEFESR